MRILSFDVGVRHLAVAELDVDDGPMNYRLVRWRVLDVTEGAGMPKNKAIDTISQMLLDALDREFNDPSTTYDVVLIENQPANKNPLMKSVQMIIYTFFNCHRMYVGNVGAVRLVSATRKLHLLHAPAATVVTHTPPAPPLPPVSGTIVSGTRTGMAAAYKERKQAAVRIAQVYLANVFKRPDMLEVLAASKKKDDLCDCLLQAVWFTENGGALRH
jgi:hypothetical protein